MTLSELPRPYRILIVDDIPAERVAIRAAIEAAGSDCEIAEADSVESAERILIQGPFPFDVAVVDLRLHGMDDGLVVAGLIKRVLERHVQTRVVIVTAFPSIETACAAYEAGASAYISKLDEDTTNTLQRKVRELLEQRDLRDNLNRQYVAQREAQEAFEGEREEWIRHYGGKFVVVRNREVLEAYENPRELWEDLRRFTTAEQAELGIVQVPATGDEDGNR